MRTVRITPTFVITLLLVGVAAAGFFYLRFRMAKRIWAEMEERLLSSSGSLMGTPVHHGVALERFHFPEGCAVVLSENENKADYRVKISAVYRSNPNAPPPGLDTLVGLSITKRNGDVVAQKLFSSLDDMFRFTANTLCGSGL